MTLTLIVGAGGAEKPPSAFDFWPTPAPPGLKPGHLVRETREKVDHRRVPLFSGCLTARVS